MSANAQSFSARRSGGVRHTPEADIESIRDLLRGYGSSRSILKELIQNAEDSGASRMEMLYLPGDPASPHSLLRGPGLLVANNGTFTQENRDAITQINLGTKGTEERAIGRFGKGLKSVFAWCEAFFIIARTDRNQGWPDDSITDFFNPWHGWRHQDWEDEFEKSGDILLIETRKHFADIYSESDPWLAFWFPLRCELHTKDGDDRESFDNGLPGEDPSFIKKLATELQTLAPSLVSLRNLQRIAIMDGNGGKQTSLIWEFPQKSERIPAPDSESDSVKFVSGETTLRADCETPLRYCGFAGRLPDQAVDQLKTAADWPRVVQRTRDRSKAGCPVKGEAHFATLLTWGAVNEDKSPGSLDVRWCVFFPVGKQPPGVGRIELPTIRRPITLNLHGFFFLDSERLRIDGLDDAFSHNGSTAIRVCVEWNRILATQGTLARLPAALAAFADQESFTNPQCNELAHAIQQTGVWSNFRDAVCHLETWRPRWRSGAEKWELVPVGNTVLFIPRISATGEVLARLPKLASLSELVTLVARGSDKDLPGLYDGAEQKWPENLVLQLLDGVQLSPTADQAAADWINALLTYLHETHSLTPAIRERVSTLPLLPVRVARTGVHRRVSAGEWDAAIAADQLFAPATQTDGWLRLLHPALPDWSCIIAEWTIPGWFTGQRPPLLNALTAASAVVSQSTLGEFTALAELVRHFISQPGLPDSLRLAVRYLMHGHAAHAQDREHFLFMPSTQPGMLIWSRLIKQLLIHEGGENSWRLLHQQWASVLSPQAQKDLTVSTIDQLGAWEELMTAQADFSTLEFPATEWSASDIATLLHGLFQVGQSNLDGTIALLRKLRLHNLRGQSNERVSVAAADGRLGDLFVLQTLNFEASIPKELLPLWERFLSTTKIVERVQDGLAATVQEKLFRNTTAEGEEYDATLDWNYVVRRCLESSDACAWAPLIMEALSHGDLAVRGLGPKLKQTEWLPLSSAGSLAPDSIIMIDGLEVELHELLDPAEDGLAGTRALSEAVVGHDGFATLKKYFPNIEEALGLLGLWLKDKPDWHLGLAESSLPPELDKFLPSVETLPELPGAGLLAKLWRLPSQAESDEWDALLREHIWPAILRPFAYEQDGVIRLERVLSQLATTPTRIAFDAYLRQAVADTVVVPMLPRLSLVNQRGQWRLASQLIWPSANLDPAAQLCQEQDHILSAIRVAPIQPGTAAPAQRAVQGRLELGDNRLDSEPDFPAQAKILAGYLQPFRNGNVGEILPAALVAVLGSHPTMLALLRELLQAGFGQDPDDFLTYLLGEQRTKVINEVRSQRFLIEIVHGRSTHAQTITGDRVTVDLTTDINTLIVGDSSELWRRYFYQHRPETECHRLRLRAIERPDDLSDPVAIFASTIETILLKVHCNGVTSLCPSNLKEVLGEVADAGQADLRRSQLYLLDMAEARLKELAVRSIPEFEQVLRQFSDARQARVDADLFQTRSPARAREKLEKAEKLITEAKRTLVSLLQSPEDEATRRTLVEAVRRKMTDFQYSLDSVALELFQNADDAVAEWEEMKQELHPHERQFVVHLDATQRQLELIHWGRPINRHAFAGFLHGLKRGYDQDLQKMLTLNFSDKGVGSADQPVIVTGRFGLGFKTVFFVADQPEVISGRLAFEIRGGFFPVPLPLDNAKALREWADSLGVPGLVPTAIRLKWAADTKAEELSKAFDAFTCIAPLLAIFSRRIRTLSVKNGDDSVTITSHEEKLTDSGRLTHIQVAQKAYLCFRCPLRADERPASVLIQLDASGVSHLPESLPRLWITTPTTEHSDLRWAVNAPFKPDAGRQRLALNNPVNRQIAEEVAHTWLQSLLELYDETQARWDAFALQLDLHSTASFENWWLQLWNEMTRTWPVCKWENLRDGGQVLGYIAWGQSTGAMLRLIQQRSAIPSNLPGAYARLVKSGDVHFSIAGLLADQANGCLALIAEWVSAQTAFPPGQTVDAEVAQFLKQTLPAQKLKGELNLRTALNAELGENQEVNHLIGERLGQLFLQCKALFDTSSPYSSEVQPLLSSLNQAKLLASDGKYYPAPNLICPRSLDNLIDKDEADRAKFAPASAVLSTGYSEAALHFFVKARGQLAANAIMLAAWVRQASPEQLPAIFRYLIEGELGQQLADELKRPWLDTQRATSAFQSLLSPDQNELERKFSRGRIIITQTPIEVSIIELPPAVQVMEADVAFRLVSEWWTREHATWTADYEARTYPPGFPGTLPWPGEDEWDASTAPSAQARWLLLFVQAALVPLGFNRIGRDQSFTRFLVQNDWVDVLARVSHDPNVLFTVLDDYLGAYIQNTQFHFQMRQFIAFYAVSRNLDSFLHSLRAAESSTQPDAFNLVFSPNANPALSGTGIVAPPLSGMLGMGTCQLLRELYRLGRLSNPHGYQFAFTPIRKVRRLCTQLFGTSEGDAGAAASMAIFSELQAMGTELKLDPTFKHSFDLPFQILAENKSLRITVLREDFEAEAMDSPELDAAPRNFSF